MKIAKFPGVWGLIDGTHVPVQVKNNQRDRFWDRKGKTSLDIQVVVGPNMKIIDFVNRYNLPADISYFKTLFE